MRHVQQKFQNLEAISPFSGATETPIFQRVFSLQVYKNVVLQMVCDLVCASIMLISMVIKRNVNYYSVWNSTRNSNKFIENMFVTQPMICDRL